MQDRREAELVRGVEEARANMIARAEAVRHSAVSLLDPREALRRNPVGGILVAIASGVVLNALGSARDHEPAPPADRRTPRGPLAGLFDAALPGLIETLVAPALSSLLGRFGTPRPGDPPPRT